MRDPIYAVYVRSGLVKTSEVLVDNGWWLVDTSGQWSFDVNTAQNFKTRRDMDNAIQGMIDNGHYINKSHLLYVRVK